MKKIYIWTQNEETENGMKKKERSGKLKRKKGVK